MLNQLKIMDGLFVEINWLSFVFKVHPYLPFFSAFFAYCSLYPIFSLPRVKLTALMRAS
jgi:hypothetical protein